MKKGRLVILQEHADITIGQSGDLLAKSIQLKSCTTEKPNDVDTMIAKAAYQLSGAKGEMPREHDRRIIDIAINNINNPWPYTSRPLSTCYGLDELIKTAKARILEYALEDKSEAKRGFEGAPEYLTALKVRKELEWAQVMEVLPRPSVVGHKSTTLSIKSSTNPSSRYIPNLITVKIRYIHPRTVTLGNLIHPRTVTLGNQSTDQLKTAVFAIHSLNGKPCCECYALDLEENGKRFFQIELTKL